MEATAKATANPSNFRRIATKEVATFVGLLFFGIALMPILIYWVGQGVFGTYGGAGYGDFFGTLVAKIRNGDGVAWFLVLSPYAGWQCVRLAALGWRASAALSEPE